MFGCVMLIGFLLCCFGWLVCFVVAFGFIVVVLCLIRLFVLLFIELFVGDSDGLLGVCCWCLTLFCLVLVLSVSFIWLLITLAVLFCYV